MLTQRNAPYIFAILHVFSLHGTVSLARADCAPFPIAAKIGNVTLDNTTARGVSLSLGVPEQEFAFLPQWPLNHSFVYGTDGFCGDSWSEAACQTFRGGEYNASASTTHQDATAQPDLTESSPYPTFSWVTDTFKLGSNSTLSNFPIGIPQADWGEQGYHPQAALGLGKNSTILNALYTGSYIASRSWAMFWGQTGATASTQQDGNFVFGGFDRAKVSGQNYTSDLNYNDSDCPTGMFVTVTDMILNFANGSSASLFDGFQSSAMSACIVPDYPVLMTLPFEPYFEKFQMFTNQLIQERSYGIYYYGMLYSDVSDMYTGDLTITMSSGFSVRIPNDQLVVPNLTIDKESGALVANGSAPELVLNSIQSINEGDLPQLGRQFLSAAYLMVNQDANTFTLWEASHNANEDLVSIDENNQVVDQFCTTTAKTNTSHPSQPTANTSSHDDNHSIPGGIIAGAVIGSVAGVAMVVYMFFCLRAKNKKSRGTARTDLAHVDECYYPEIAGHELPIELEPKEAVSGVSRRPLGMPPSHGSIGVAELP
ncbi:hypothetical protein DTO166G4_827 [Paecilomyces variotii]|nr:hypothetical protein DTO166G4_827 [Paecilomyces variotii]KAJ9238593.1 hypothetical protein DTO169E5_4793 [Paecilomyces variotii]KAJ9243186.1 hypothetical protein DTO166G5_290 [Paecilomyces variotii]KAJ9310325.1 hypothetical protein DTO217A2_104 [Paecilomyces variotii]